MKAYAQVKINGTKDAVWNTVTNIEESKDIIKGIVDVEVLNKPNDTLMGLKWKETRVMFGKEATETMWITDFIDHEYYETRAESHGAVYTTHVVVKEVDDGCLLEMDFEGKGVTPMAKLSGWIFEKMIRKSTEKALQEDLQDIKLAIEH